MKQFRAGDGGTVLRRRGWASLVDKGASAGRTDGETMRARLFRSIASKERIPTENLATDEHGLTLIYDKKPTSAT